MLSTVDDVVRGRGCFDGSVICDGRGFDGSMFELDSLDAMLMRGAIAEVEDGEAMMAMDGEGGDAVAMVEGDDASDDAMLLCTCVLVYPTSSVGLLHFLIDYDSHHTWCID
jgi:hypothetical protein